MGLKRGMRVLDVGCGIGGPAREMAQFLDIHIVGLNNNDYQIGRARSLTAKAGLSDRLTFVKGDFMKLSEQFGEGSFDAGAQSSYPIRIHSYKPMQSTLLRRPSTHPPSRVYTVKSSRFSNLEEWCARSFSLYSCPPHFGF